MILSLDRVSKRYERGGRQVTALSEVTLELRRGDFVGIFGPSGAGKTTLLRIIAGLERADRGTVVYQGRRLDQMSREERSQYRRRTIGCVWGDGALETGLDVMQTVALPLLLDGWDRQAAKRRARECLIAAGAEHCAGAELRELSDGERQRLAIAQAIASEPRLILGDEPASNLDMEERDAILFMLQTQAAENSVAVLIVDSDPLALMRSSPLLYMRDGEIQEADRAQALADVLPLHPGAATRRHEHA